MKINGIEISGINRIAIRENGKEGVLWRKKDGMWHKVREPYDTRFDVFKTHENRVSFIKWAIAHPEMYRVWFRENTVNIQILTSEIPKPREFVMTSYGDFVEVKTVD